MFCVISVILFCSGFFFITISVCDLLKRKTIDLHPHCRPRRIMVVSGFTRSKFIYVYFPNGMEERKNEKRPDPRVKLYIITFAEFFLKYYFVHLNWLIICLDCFIVVNAFDLCFSFSFRKFVCVAMTMRCHKY